MRSTGFSSRPEAGSEIAAAKLSTPTLNHRRLNRRRLRCRFQGLSLVAGLVAVSARVSLKFHLRSESKNNRALHASARVRVVLNDRLQKEHRQGVQKPIDLHAVPPPPSRRAGQEKLLAQAISDIPQGH